MSDEPEVVEPRLSRAGTWLDAVIPPSIQRGIISAVILTLLVKMGVSVDTVSQLAASNHEVAVGVSTGVTNLEAVVMAALDKSFDARRKTMTLTQDVARIESEVLALTAEVRLLSVKVDDALAALRGAK